ncbi:MAG: transporter substrate-binding domain-containing protein [Myxococcaceae bacterium]|nr:transporter substrate-binding domain-containing protein [Myxococcaceae bacterium]
MRRRWNRWWLLLGALALVGAGLVLARVVAQSRTSDPLTREEREWLRQHDGRIVLGTYSGAPPFSFVNERGAYSGMAADYVRLLEQKLGFLFHIDPPLPIEEVVRAVREGEVDVTALLAKSPERAALLSFTEPLVSAPTVILVRRGRWEKLSLDELRGLRVGVGKGYALEDYLRDQYPALHLLPVEDNLEGLRRLATGELDALLADIATASYLISEENITNLHVAGDVPFRYQLAFGVRKDQAVLESIIRKGQARITPGERKAIWERWVIQWEEPFYRQASFWRFVALLAAGVGLLVGAVVLWNKALQRQVRAKTAELAEANRRVSFLAESGVILSETLDSEQTFARLGELLVREFGGWCSMAVMPDGQIRRVGWAHADPGKRALVEALVMRYPARAGDPGPSGQVLTDGKAHLAAELTEQDLRAIARNEEHAALFRMVGTRTALAVPLIARGQMLGMLTLASGVPGRRFGHGELELAQEVARRAAIALDNARLFAQAQDAIHMRDLFLVVAAHELRTPLTSLNLRLEKLGRLARKVAPDTLPTSRVLSELGVIEKQTHKLGALIEQLLDVSRLTAGTLELRPEPVDVCRLVRDVAEAFQEQASRSGSRLELQANCSAEGWFDRLRLEQVVGNLVSNALKFGGGKPIEVRIEPVPGRVRISVRDHGIGLTDEAKARIFEKFERAVSERHYGGLGLGLYISRQLVEAHGGTITVESAPGAGSTFTVDLPRERP